jgi:hypothetical protein
MGIALHAEFRNIPALKKLLGEEISVEVATAFIKRTCYEDGKAIEGEPTKISTYKSKLLDLGKHGLFLENKKKSKDIKPKETMILHVDEGYVRIPAPRDKTYLPFLDAECIYNEKKQEITYTGILSIKHKNNLIYKRTPSS